MTRTALFLVAAALLSAAPAAAQTVRVPFRDLDLSTAAGAETFDARAAEAGRAVCARRPARSVNIDCVRRLQREAVRRLPRPVRAAYARGRRGDSDRAMVAPAWPA